MKQQLLRLSFDVEGAFRKNPHNAPVAREEEMVKKIIALLKKYHRKATWAVVGKLYEENPNLTRLLHGSGHEIASHSYTHPDFTKISEKEAREEMKKSMRPGVHTFVYPYNHVAYQELLPTYGFDSYRVGGMYFPSNRKWGTYIPRGWRFMAAKIGVNWARVSGTSFGLWTHPIDLVDPDLFAEFSRIIAYVSTL